MKKFLAILFSLAVLTACARGPEAPEEKAAPATSAMPVPGFKNVEEMVVVDTEDQNDEEVSEAAAGPASPQAREIAISAKRWEFSPADIRVKKGETVRLVIDNTDTTHGITIPELGLAGNEEITFTAEKTGAFEFRCANYCGEGHAHMDGTLIVEE